MYSSGAGGTNPTNVRIYSFFFALPAESLTFDCAAISIFLIFRCLSYFLWSCLIFRYLSMAKVVFASPPAINMTVLILLDKCYLLLSLLDGKNANSLVLNSNVDPIEMTKRTRQMKIHQIRQCHWDYYGWLECIVGTQIDINRKNKRAHGHLISQKWKWQTREVDSRSWVKPQSTRERKRLFCGDIITCRTSRNGAKSINSFANGIEMTVFWRLNDDVYKLTRLKGNDEAI